MDTSRGDQRAARHVGCPHGRTRTSRPPSGGPHGPVTARLAELHPVHRDTEPPPAPDPWSPLDPAEADALLAAGRYGLRLDRDRCGRLLLTGPGTGRGLPLGRDPRWTDLYRALIRLRRTRQRYDPEWLRRLTGSLPGAARPIAPAPPAPPGEVITAGPEDHLVRDCVAALTGTAPRPATRAGRSLQLDVAGDRTEVLHRIRGWRRLAAAVESDPVLRMHCATQPTPAAVVDAGSGTAALARVPDPAPAHPAHPGGTVVAPLAALLGGPGEPPKLLRTVVGNRFERHEDGLDHFLEHFVRPLLRTFRLALDGHRLGLFSLDAAGVGFELSPELEATGRVVVTDCARVSERPTEAEVAAGVQALVGTLDRLSEGFGRTGPGYRSVRRAVDRVIGEELRYLAPRTAELLGGRHPLRCFVHSVPEEQHAVLTDVLGRVQERTRRRRWDPGLPQPAVVIDVDLCALLPLQRILDAVRSVSGPRPGAPEGIPEFSGPGALPVLPTHAVSTWRHFVDRCGLRGRYPEVDWHQVRSEFLRAFLSRPQDRLRGDGVNAGLARFVWDVQDAGGRVVFCTGRRERYREHTEDVLRAAGVPAATLLFLPDDRTRPRCELTVERLRDLGPVDVVAVFDDLVANRLAVAKEFTGALPVAVAAPGLATEHPPEEPAVDTDAVIATFETSPRPRSGPRLSHTHSLEELQVGALRQNRLARRWAVHLSESESLSIVGSILADGDRAAARVARGAAAKFGLDRCRALPDRRDRVVRALHHVLTRKQFIKGARAHYPVEDLRRDVEPFLRQDRPIDVVLLGFPVKQCLNRLKAAGPLPDLAELGGLARLRELQRAVSAIHPPGLHFNILSDGRHFRSRPPAITEAYRRKLREYVELVGIADCTTVEEIDEVAGQRLGPDLHAVRAARISRYRALLADSLRDFDITDEPLRTLERVHERTAGITGLRPHIVGLFREMLMSLIYSVPVGEPPGGDRLAWSAAVYADIYNTTDRGVPAAVRAERSAVLRRAWRTAIRYLATLQVDEDLGYERMFGHRVRLTVTASRPGCLGFTYLGGSGLLPWQGTGVVDGRGQVAVDFAISTLDQGFVPVYSPLLGPRQPWLMVPADRTELPEPGHQPVPAQRGAEPPPAVSGGVRLDPDFAARIRLRRR
ncbi:L-tyrosine/L-tryptophan isonitrile synthase family protein [Saccharopolyspora cebuensis]|uniref:L-tyrosine/L-tryptophan isonitrile synthase family protein n=1 Tax=Saccharopolyspora cebuensis TaxID=418759 RepID=A0ABV4CLU4_9PSEU